MNVVYRKHIRCHFGKKLSLLYFYNFICARRGRKREHHGLNDTIVFLIKMKMAISFSVKKRDFTNILLDSGRVRFKFYLTCNFSSGSLKVPLLQSTY